MSTPLPTTKLEAVNLMLYEIGEAGVDALDSDLEEVRTALTMLDNTLITVLMKGWSFNTEYTTLEPAVSTGSVEVPATTLQVDAANPYEAVAQRGKYLYDVANKTFVFQRPVKVKLVLSLDFDDLPMHAKAFVLARAGRKFGERFLGAQNTSAFSQQHELETQQAFNQVEARVADHNILTGSSASQRILNRRPRSRR